MKSVIYLALVVLFASCGKQENGKVSETQTSEHSVTKKYEPTVKVSKNSQEKIENWKEYNRLTDFIEKFLSISPNEALINARELNLLTQSLSDNIKPPLLETSAFKARANLLYNETLRLYDMASIPAIKAEEVNLQVVKILEAYSSMNLKINAVIRQKKLNEEIEKGVFKKDSIPE